MFLEGVSFGWCRLKEDAVCLTKRCLSFIQFWGSFFWIYSLYFLRCSRCGFGLGLISLNFEKSSLDLLEFPQPSSWYPYLSPQSTLLFQSSHLIARTPLLFRLFVIFPVKIDKERKFNRNIAPIAYFFNLHAVIDTP